MLLLLFVSAVLGNPLFYAPEPGPTWFIFWLVIFNTAYALMNHDKPSESVGMTTGAIQPPTLLHLFVAGVVLGSIQGVLIYFSSSFIMMPITWGSLPLDIAAFSLGCSAGRHGWLDTFFETLDVDDAKSVWTLPLRFGAVLSLSLFALDSSRLFLSVETDFSKKLASSAYAVYLVHPLIVTPLTSAAVLVLDKSGQHIVFSGHSTTSSSVVHPHYLLWCAWACVVVLSLIFSWVSASFLRALPGFKEVL
jgi:hypothetical protein